MVAKGIRYDVYIGILPDSSLATIKSDSITCPLGQLVIASYATRRIKKLRARVYNGMRTSSAMILSHIRKEVIDGKKVAVGITLTAGNTSNGFEIAKKADEVGGDVFIGGTETTMCEKEILRNRQYIKAAIIGAGERVMTKILKGVQFESIPNIAYKLDDDLIQTRCDPELLKLDFDNIIVDYSLLHDIDSHNGISYLYGNDCQFANRQRCYFCGRPSLGVGFRDEKLVWKELSYLYDKGIATFYNTMDNSAVSISRLRRLAWRKPPGLRFDRHRMFINAAQVNPRTVEYLKRMNAIAAIGLENFPLMKDVGKGMMKPIDILNALHKLKNARIPLFLSMVLGIPGETIETLSENKKWIEYITREFGTMIDEWEISPLMVTTGSRAYHDLMNLARMRKKYSSKEMPYDVFEMSEDYFDNFCEVSRAETLKKIEEIKEMITRIAPKVHISGHLPHYEVQIKGMQ